MKEPDARGAAVLFIAAILVPSLAFGGFVTFESGQVRPLALLPGGSRLGAVNTPDNRLELFDVGAAGLTHAASVVVGLEPVAVAARTAGEVWVVNHLSDSVSVVDVAASPPRVVRTLLVGDEPRDIVFGGPGGTRAFITCAHRGQAGGPAAVDGTHRSRRSFHRAAEVAAGTLSGTVGDQEFFRAGACAAGDSRRGGEG